VALALTLLLVAVPPVKTAWVIAALSPHVTLCSALALRLVGMLLVYCIPVIVISLFVRRFFCRFMCPVGLLAELCGKAGPGPGPRIGKLPRIGQWLAMASLGAAIFGCPLFLWLDPLAIFGGAVGAIGVPITIVSLIPAALLGAVLLVSFIVPNLWCGRLCPLGGTQDILADLGGLAKRAKPGMQPIPKKVMSVARRTTLCAGAGAAWSLAIPKLFRSGAAPLRPPGSRDEMTFKSLCIRCGACVRACPSKIIKRDLAGERSSFLSPVVRYSPGLYPNDYCLEDCNKCTQVCPTGAIEQLDLTQKNLRQIGLAHVDRGTCYLSIPEDCEICVPVCPPRAIEARFSYEHGSVLEIDPALCNGCGKCRTACPAKCLTIEPV